MALDYEVHLRSPLTAKEYDDLVGRVLSHGPCRILDWGAGFGQNSARLAAAGFDVEAFDYRPQDHARPGGRQPFDRYPDLEVFVEKDDPVALPYGDASFDAVLSMGVLEHVADPHASLDEIRRVLRPRGRLWVFKLPNRFSYTERLGRRAGYYWHGMLPDDRLYTLGSAVALVRAHGFEVVQARRANMLPLNRPGERWPQHAERLWKLNTALARTPLLNLLATNVEVVAVRP